MVQSRPPIAPVRNSLLTRIAKDFSRNKYIYLMLVPVLCFYILFKYGPMTKMVIAFQDYNLYKGIAGSKWVGFENFIKFFQMKDCWRLIRNTLVLSLYSIAFHFPMPILLALMINEVKNSLSRRVIQTVSYMPHFISVVVVCGLLRNFCSSGGILNQIALLFTPSWSSPNLLSVSEYYRTIHIASSMWQEVGWDSIIYLATLSSIDPQLYEASYIDGANKLQRIIHITLPGLVPVITVHFIMRVGRVMSVAYEKILLLYNASIYETSDVIATFLYRYALLNGKYSMGSAIGVFNSVISIIILVSVNALFKKFAEDSLW
jgi:putative aldouronate transport system permease protein